MTILSDDDLAPPPRPLPPRGGGEAGPYNAIEAINWSTLVHIDTSPRMLQWRKQHPRPDTGALRLGRAIHIAVLEPERWSTAYTTQPQFGDLRTKAARTKRAEWLLSLPSGVEVLEPEEYELAQRCAAAVREHPVAAELLRGGRAEEVITWIDEETGLPCKARIDWIAPLYVLDLKSTRLRKLRAFGADCASRLYHGQLAFYHRGAIAARVLPSDADRPCVIGVQTVEPYDVIPAQIEAEKLDRGINLCRSLLRKYAACLAADYWPGLAPALIDLPLPEWTPSGNDEPTGDDW